MQVHDIDTWDAQEMGGGLSVTFPFSSATGCADTAAVYLVFEPGGALPEHTDSAEEWLLVLEGTVEATVGEETGILEQGQLALVPALVPHSARNAGDGQARVLGFFRHRRTWASSPSRSGPAARRSSWSAPRRTLRCP